jgi:dipeptidyl aminopeptidase/acylaminoacyl peptidase
MRFIGSFLILILLVQTAFGQDKIKYQKPPQEILELVDITLPPKVRIDYQGVNMIMMYRNLHQSIEDLSDTELKLAGLRINPEANISSRITYFNNIHIKKTSEEESKQVQGLPDHPRMAHFYWSPDQSKMAFTNTTRTGVELWVLDMNSGIANQITKAKVNANISEPYQWFQDGKSLLVKLIPDSRKGLKKDSKYDIPEGPMVTETSGDNIQNETFQDLLKNPDDEFNFEQLCLSELHQVDLNGTSTLWAPKRMYTDIKFSPDGNYVMISQLNKPFSYMVPYSRFPFKTILYTSSGEPLRAVNQVPLIEQLPNGFMSRREGKRDLQWRYDKPSSIVWVEALDGGDQSTDAEFRDEIFQMDVPAYGDVKSLIKLKNRFLRIDWCDDEHAVAYDWWWNSRNMKSYLFNPSDPESESTIISDRNYQDRYNDPGQFAAYRNQYGHYVLINEKNNFFLIGEGFSEEGQFPFINKYNIKSGKITNVYKSEYTDKMEVILDILDAKEMKFIVSLESPSEYVNYFFKTVKGKNVSKTRLSNFQNPFTSIQNVHKEVISYKRKDGLELSATMYLPVGYDMKNKEKMPLIIWAYPYEFKDKQSASQITSNPNQFTFPNYDSMIWWVTRGYVVLDDAAFPIVGEGDKQPNDTYIEQLVANAEAAIDAVDSLGYIDRNRVAVGGHSYGAFMTANLLTHTDLFAAGIAQSGAYNRSLTPFGFQNERRNYWEAPEVYTAMSPFMHADKMKTPLLLIHGDADNNSGTFPMQSERYFKALKGLGATARLVMLPKESHLYRAKESIMHVLWEQDQWLEKYVKNKGE